MAKQLVKPHFKGPYKAVQYTMYVWGVEAGNGVNVGDCKPCSYGKMFFTSEATAKAAADSYNTLWPTHPDP